MSKNIKSSKKKKIIISATSIVVVIAIIISILLINRKTDEPFISADSITELKLSDFENTISGTGTVQSSSPSNIYSSITSKVKEVYVNVGDTVAEGDLLCTMDTSNIEEQIKSAENSLKKAKERAEEQVKNAQETYDNAKYALDNGKNQVVAAAKTNLDNAENNLKKAESALKNSTTKPSQNNSENNKKETEALSNNTTRIPVNNSGITIPTQSPEDAYNTAKANYDSALKTYTLAVQAAESSVDSAYNNLQTAKANSTLITEPLTAEISKLKTTLDDANIRADKAGTITEVNAVADSMCMGSLFVIENTSDLVITASVNQSDINTIKKDMKISITSDYTGDNVYYGTIVSISPTAGSNSSSLSSMSSLSSLSSISSLGNLTSDSASGSDFSVEIKVDSKDTGLLIGTSVNIKYILDSEKNVICVPFDAVLKDENGKNTILTAKEQEDGGYLILQIDVETGAENDLDIIINSDEIIEGTKIITEPDSYKEYIGQILQLSESKPTEMR